MGVQAEHVAGNVLDSVKHRAIKRVTVFLAHLLDVDEDVFRHNRDFKRMLKRELS